MSWWVGAWWGVGLYRERGGDGGSRGAWLSLGCMAGDAPCLMPAVCVLRLTCVCCVNILWPPPPPSPPHHHRPSPCAPTGRLTSWHPVMTLRVQHSSRCAQHTEMRACGRVCFVCGDASQLSECAISESHTMAFLCLNVLPCRCMVTQTTWMLWWGCCQRTPYLASSLARAFTQCFCCRYGK